LCCLADSGSVFSYYAMGLFNNYVGMVLIQFTTTHPCVRSQTVLTSHLFYLSQDACQPLRGVCLFGGSTTAHLSPANVIVEEPLSKE